MDAGDLLPLLEQLEAQIDDLRDALDPLLVNAISQNAVKLPLLDKAKLHVLATYAIESILFSYLRLNGVDARQHRVFRELTRVKQYFEKIKQVEKSGAKRENLSLDKEAANRFIKHALAGNDKYDLERAEQQAKERAKAHIKFQELSKKRKAPETEPTEDEEKISSPIPEMVESVPQKLDDLSIDEDTPDQIPKKRKRKDKAVQKQETVEDPSTEEAAAKTKRRELKRQRKEERREKRRQEDEAKESELILASSKQPLSAAFQARFSKPP